MVDVDGGEGRVRGVGVDLHVGGGRGGGEGRPGGGLRVPRGGDHPQSRRRLQARIFYLKVYLSLVDTFGSQHH